MKAYFFTDAKNVWKIKTCTQTGKEYKVTITFDQFIRWKKDKELIQNICPELTAEQRDFLITGMTEEEQNIFYNLNQ